MRKSFNSLELRMKMEFIRQQTMRHEVRPYKRELKARRERALDRYMERIAMDVYLEAAGDR